MPRSHVTKDCNQIYKIDKGNSENDKHDMNYFSLFGSTTCQTIGENEDKEKKKGKNKRKDPRPQGKDGIVTNNTLFCITFDDIVHNIDNRS
jgi:hypothetical protein